MKGMIIASGILGLLVGSGLGIGVDGWRGERYQAVLLRDMIIARLDTKTGEIKVFVPAQVAAQEEADALHLLGVGRSFERRVSPSDVNRVTDPSAITNCDYVGYMGTMEDADAVAKRGGDTLFRGKNKAGREGVWMYRCKAR